MKEQLPYFLSKIRNLQVLSSLRLLKMALLLMLIPCVANAQYTSDRTYNLNLVYFIPNNNPAIPGYEKRLSEFMLWLQDYYGKEMQKNGYGYKTFGLMKDDVNQRVKITMIYGKLDKDSYGYDSGASNVRAEVDAYYAAHPNEKMGEHFLILLPDNPKTATDPNATGGPFFGTGKYCYAKDIDALDIKYIGTADWAKWAGGLAHELGHGLNLPHDRQKASEEATLGMSLMWAGNSTLGRTPTFLTATDCAILNVNQIFNTDTKTYYGNVNSSIKRIHASYSTTKKAIVVSGKFTTDTPVNSVVFYNDPNSHDANMVYEGTGVNHDYNAITWETKTVGIDSFYVEMPTSELVLKDDLTPYELKVKLVHNNGNVKETIYNYNFTNGIPVLKFSTIDEISKTGWSITASSQQTTSPATNIIDNDPATGWHSQWSTPPAATYPHTITIDLGKTETLYGYSIANPFRRAIKNAELLYSVDGINFTSLGDFEIPKASYTQDFPAGPLTFRYFRIIAKSSWDGEQFAQLAEVGFYKEQDLAPIVAISSPSDNASFLLGQNISLMANASDIGGTISKVEFFNGTTKLGEALTAPYTFNWTNAPIGQYIITAKATDNSGDTSVSGEITISVKAMDNLFPVADSYVRDGSSASSNFGTATTLTVKKDAAGFNRITYLKFNLSQYKTDTFDIGKLKMAVQAAGTGAATADFQLWYCSTDAWTETGTNSINWNNKPALTTLLGTQKGKAAGGTMEWDINNQLKTEINGDKTLTLAIVSNTQGSPYDVNFHSKEATTIALRPQIIAEDRPKITLTSPANGIEVNIGTALTLSANAIDDRAVDNVKFFINGIEKATITTAPYTWNTANLDMGTYTISARATDVSGFTTDTAPITITVKDLTPPVINCSENIAVNNDKTLCGAIVNFETTATDNLGEVTVTYSQNPGTVFPIGTTTVTATATDAQGNTATCSFDVTVTDSTAPTIVCPENIVLTACQDTAVWSLPAVTDNCPNVTLTQTAGPASGSVFANGTVTTISYEAKDASGNTANCSFTVTRQAALDIAVTNSNPQLYFGYTADQTTTITGIPTGGTAPYNVVITIDRSLSSADETWTTENNSVTASLKENALFTVTVTDANGCTASKTTLVNAEDVRCFAGNNTKIKICHKSGNGSCQELCIAESAVAAHLNHGDSLGGCPASCLNNSAEEASVFNIKAYPNPSYFQFNLIIEGGSNEDVDVQVYNMLGKRVKQIKRKAGQSIAFGEEFVTGEYIAVVRQGQNTKTVNLIKK